MKEEGTETLSQALTGRVRIKFRSLNPSSTAKQMCSSLPTTLPLSPNTEQPGGSCCLEASSEVPLGLLEADSLLQEHVLRDELPGCDPLWSVPEGLVTPPVDYNFSSYPPLAFPYRL